MICFIYEEILSVWDLLLPPLYIIVIIIIASNVRRKNIGKNPAYKYFMHGLIAKIIGAVTICFIYVFYYNGGDTTEYYLSATCVDNLLHKSLGDYLQIVFGLHTIDSYMLFDSSTGFPTYFFDTHAFSTVLITHIVMIFSFQSFINTAILLAALSYIGIWKLYLLFCQLYPQLIKQFAISFLFLPSVVFWGSGILKDTVTLSAACWFSYSFYYVFIKKEAIGINVFFLFLMAYLLIIIKPYIFIALMPGSILWLYSSYVKKISNKAIKVLIAPVLLSVSLVISYYIFTNIGSSLGQYSTVDNILNKAVATQRDFVNNKDYGTHYFDLGEFDASTSSLVSKFPTAVVAGLFRPFVWESKNVVMLIAALENISLMGLSIFLIVRIGLFKFFKYITKEPILFFSIVFSLIFAFSVGITTANFGAMVRYKIPAMPFYLSSMLILNHFYKSRKVGVYKK